MAASPLDPSAQAVLGQFGLSSPTRRVHPQGNGGGFSGAGLWRIEERGEAYCLRAWPSNYLTPDSLTYIHGLMRLARQTGLSCVPAVLATPAGRTWVEQAGRLWDLTSWLPGRADFHEQPSLARLEAACVALAHLHNAWARAGVRRGTCPAVLRRLDGCRAWSSLLASGWRPTFAPLPPNSVHGWAERVWELLPGRIEQVPRRLAPWLSRELSLQPCLCDIWHDHVLFEGQDVTGIVDYGSVKGDHVAVDLARLLGSLVPEDRGAYEAGLAAYVRCRPLTEEEKALVTVLDETGTWLAAVTWLKWLYLEGRQYEDMGTVAARLAGLVRRLEGEWDARQPSPGPV
jgi:Ser/Thr protein kinase RdoA (MazF antagonist)